MGAWLPFMETLSAPGLAHIFFYLKLIAKIDNNLYAKNSHKAIETNDQRRFVIP